MVAMEMEKTTKFSSYYNNGCCDIRICFLNNGCHGNRKKHKVFKLLQQWLFIRKMLYQKQESYRCVVSLKNELVV